MAYRNMLPADDLALTLAQQIASGGESDAEAALEEFLVDDGWKTAEPDRSSSRWWFK